MFVKRGVNVIKVNNNIKNVSTMKSYDVSSYNRNAKVLIIDYAGNSYWNCRCSCQKDNDKLMRALALCDYFWSEEGHELNSFGPASEGYVEGTFNYQGREVAKFTQATLDQLNKYFLINQMPIISGRYWNMVHGSTPEQVKQDLEGMQNMRIVGKNMAWHLKCKQAGIEAGIVPPEAEETIYTNFIRE